MNAPATSRIHPFAHLGPAPYRVIGAEHRVGPITLADGTQVGSPGQPMGACQHCGQGIAEVWTVRASDGITFEVGCVCVGKAAKEGRDTTLETDHKRFKAQHARDMRQAKARRDREWIAATLADPAVAARFAAVPHSLAWRAAKGETLLDDYHWMLRNCGAAGLATFAKFLKGRIAEIGR